MPTLYLALLVVLLTFHASFWQIRLKRIEDRIDRLNRLCQRTRKGLEQIALDVEVVKYAVTDSLAAQASAKEIETCIKDLQEIERSIEEIIDGAERVSTQGRGITEDNGWS